MNHNHRFRIFFRKRCPRCKVRQLRNCARSGQWTVAQIQMNVILSDEFDVQQKRWILQQVGLL